MGRGASLSRILIIDAKEEAEMEAKIEKRNPRRNGVFLSLRRETVRATTRLRPFLAVDYVTQERVGPAHRNRSRRWNRSCLSNSFPPRKGVPSTTNRPPDRPCGSKFFSVSLFCCCCCSRTTGPPHSFKCFTCIDRYRHSKR